MIGRSVMKSLTHALQSALGPANCNRNKAFSTVPSPRRRRFRRALTFAVLRPRPVFGANHRRAAARKEGFRMRDALDFAAINQAAPATRPHALNKFFPIGRTLRCEIVAGDVVEEPQQ